MSDPTALVSRAFSIKDGLAGVAVVIVVLALILAFFPAASPEGIANKINPSRERP